MIDFSNVLDLPLIWGVILATAIFLYVILDGFDLGCGILFPFAPTDDCRSRMMNSIAPFWDANETWLVLGGGGLLVAFPVAYAIIMPAFYLPIILMLMGLIFRGVAFEFRFKASEGGRKLWDGVFHGGSLLATFMQGVILANFVRGIPVEGRAFSGAPLEWANGFSILNGLSLVYAYGLLGATWLIMKTEGETQVWARSAAKYLMAFVAVAMIVVGICIPFVDPRMISRWTDVPYAKGLFLLPILLMVTFSLLWKDIHDEKREVRPFLLTVGLFLLGYAGLGISLYPWVVPFQFTLWEAAAAPTSLSIVLVGVVGLLPIILSYTAYCHYVFRGKSSHEAMY